MLRDFYKPIDEASEVALEKAQELLDSDHLLIGLGKNRNQQPVPSSANVITDFERADYLMTSQEMWDDPTQTENGDQFFSEILREAVSSTGQPKYPRDEARRRSKPLRVNYDDLDIYMKQVIEQAYIKYDVRELLYTLFDNPNIDGIKRHLDVNYPSIIYTCIGSYIRAGFYGGTSSWPFCERLYNTLVNGGVPTGWIGPTLKDGGKPDDCLQMIHFGPKLPQSNS